MFFAFKERITDRISHVAGFSVFLNITKNSTMRKQCSNVCNLRPFLDKESNNSACKRTIVAAAAIFANGTYFLDNLRNYVFPFYC
jgi:hypothetical protein